MWLQLKFCCHVNRSDHKDIPDHSTDNQQSGYSQRKWTNTQMNYTKSSPQTVSYSIFNICVSLQQLVAGSCPVTALWAPAAALLSSVGPLFTPLAHTVRDTPAWGTTGLPRIPANTPTAALPAVRANTFSSIQLKVLYWHDCVYMHYYIWRHFILRCPCYIVIIHLNIEK